MNTLKDIENQIHTSVDDYCKIAHNWEFNRNNPIIRLHEPTFGAEEINAAIDVLLSTQVTMGKRVKSFEKQFCDKYNFNNGIMNNSGSSANLLAVSALCNSDISPRLKVGDEVIVPALAWSTTIWPLIQHGLVPVIVDIDKETLNIDPKQIISAISSHTKAIMPIHVYGNPCDMKSIVDICKEKDLILIEDCCEALGAYYANKPVGNFGDISTFSFYYSHHMTTLEGGICVTNNNELAEKMRILRAHGWIREVNNPTKYAKKFPEIDPRFLFVDTGYNLRVTELQGAFGSVQLPKLESFVEKRRVNTKDWNNKLNRFSKYFDFQKEMQNGKSSCFGFPLICKPSSGINRRDIVNYLNNQGIETRPIICGNICRQPAMRKYKYRQFGSLVNADNVMDNAFSFGNHQALNDDARNYLVEKIDNYIKGLGS